MPEVLRAQTDARLRPQFCQVAVAQSGGHARSVDSTAGTWWTGCLAKPFKMGIDEAHRHQCGRAGRSRGSILKKELPGSQERRDRWVMKVPSRGGQPNRGFRSGASHIWSASACLDRGA
jgi:hypothetical protein